MIAVAAIWPSDSDCPRTSQPASTATTGLNSDRKLIYPTGRAFLRQDNSRRHAQHTTQRGGDANGVQPAIGLQHQQADAADPGHPGQQPADPAKRNST